MEEELCIPIEKVEELIRKLQEINRNYSRETIIKAIQTCCKLNKNCIEMEDCVKELTKTFHIMPN